MNNAPFYVGQKVACIDDSNITFPHPLIFKNESYTVESIGPAGDLRLLERPAFGGSYAYFGYDYARFAPIQEAYSDITAELASQVTVGDTADQPIKVLN